MLPGELKIRNTTAIRKSSPAGARRQNSPPSIAVWEITLRCDLGCRHCGSRAGRVRKDELSASAALDLVNQFADLGLKEVTLIGGEFYMRDDWDQIAAEIDRCGMCAASSPARGR